MPNGRIAGTLFIMTACALAFSWPAVAATYHVSPSGSNTPPYDSYATAAHKVSDASKLATSPGDTVLVHAGNYVSFDTILIEVGVTFAGVGRDSVTINWGNTENLFAMMVSLLGGNEVYGIEFRNPKGSSINSGITALHTFVLPLVGLPIVIHDIRVHEAQVYLDGYANFEIHDNHFNHGQIIGLFMGGQNCIVRNNLFTVSGATTTGEGYGVYAWLADTVIVENNTFHGFRDFHWAPLAMYIRDCDTVVIRNNLVRNCRRTVVLSRTDGFIENNTFIWATPIWHGSFEVYQSKNDNLTIRNNVFVDMERPITWGPQAGTDTAGVTTFVHNIFWPPRDTLYRTHPAGISPARFPVIESLNVFAYPMFADESTYCPQAGSPLIDAGDPALSDIDLTRSDIGWHGGPGGFLCGYPDLPPLPPESLWLSGDNGFIALEWSSRPESDLEAYRVYRGTSSGFWNPGLPPHKVLTAPDTAMVDTVLSAGESYCYVVTAVDASGLESDPSVERSHIISGILDDYNPGDIARSARVLKVYPNPFNAATQVEVDIPEATGLPAALGLDVWDVLGRRVSSRRSLVDQTGIQSIAWEARADNGEALSSGVYFLRVSIGKVVLEPTVRLVVVK